MGASRGYDSEVRTSQLQMKLIPYDVNSDGTMSAGSTKNEGINDFTSVRNGAGDYTLTLVNPFNRKLVAPLPSAEIANVKARVVSRTLAAVRFLFTDNAGTATDTAFSGVVVGSDDLALRG